ncbi:MAG: radical SAM protein [bacterium]|nr:radical SAM protein [bacterium]
MTEHKVAGILPEDYFNDKDGTNYRFTILRDIVQSGNNKPIGYNDSYHDEVIGYYDDYKDINLYVHVPWCVEHCSYCYYYSGGVVKRGVMDRLLEAEKKHAEMMEEKVGFENKTIRSIYFGGGTPTVLPNPLLDDFVGYFANRFGGKEKLEFCVESSIQALNRRKIDILEKYANRVSIGVQSFDNNILKIVERIHSAEKAEEILREMVPRFNSINIDLIYGLHDQSLDLWLDSVQKSIDIGVQSVTTYRLNIRETPAIIETFRKEPDRFPDENMCRRMYEEAREMYEAAGYKENLVGWFLKPQVKDTTVYRERWEKQSPCIAFGPGLDNYAADHFYQSILNHDKYIEAVNAGKLPITLFYKLDLEKQLIWYVLAQLKSNSPIYKDVIVKRFGEKRLDWFMGLARNYIAWNVLIDHGDRMEFTRENLYILEWMLIEVISYLG